MNSLKKNNIRSQFPYLNSSRNTNLVYFDNAATTHKPQCVIDSISNFYKYDNSNIHRSSHSFGAHATEKYENVRALVQDFICANNSKEIIFTSGTTESINLIAQSYGKRFVNNGDVILVPSIEHHSNMVPWQILAQERGAILKPIPINGNLMVDIDKFRRLLSDKVKLIAINHISNVTGIAQDLKSIIKESHKFNIPVLVDGAQAVSHININVVDLDCDFYCFSGHKLFGPTGTGVLFAKSDYLEQLPPYKSGGQMISKVTFDKSEWADVPHKFEAGTPNIAGIIGLGEAIQFIKNVSIKKIADYEEDLTLYIKSELKKIPNLILYGNSKKSAPIFPFNIKGVHHSDLSTLFSENNILIRSGHHCNQALMHYLGIEGCVRVSLSFYNTDEEIDRFIVVFKKIISFLKK